MSMGASYGQLYFYFYAVECALEKEKSWGLLIVSTQEKNTKRLLGMSIRLTGILYSALLRAEDANCHW